MAGRTLTDYLTWWAARDVAAGPGVRAARRMWVDRLVAPRIGGRRLTDTRAEDIAALLNALRLAGVGPVELTALHATLSAALADAVRIGLLHANPVSLVARPSALGSAWPTDTAAGAVLRAADGHRQYALYVLVLVVGLRLRDVLALRWRHVDLDAGHVVLPSDPGTRLAIGGAALDALAEHAGRYSWQRHRQSDGDDLVFVTSRGRPVRANSVYRSLHTLCRQAGVPYQPLGQLRRSAFGRGSRRAA